jgi:2Fe-2S ferredoxin
MGVIRVTDGDGRTHDIEAVEGWRVMEIIREHGFDIEGLCGGACACATCHVHVEPEWAEKLHPPHEEEESMLDSVPAVEPTSRLSCQIIFNQALDGLALRLTLAA